MKKSLIYLLMISSCTDVGKKTEPEKVISTPVDSQIVPATIDQNQVVSSDYKNYDDYTNKVYLNDTLTEYGEDGFSKESEMVDEAIRVTDEYELKKKGVKFYYFTILRTQRNDHYGKGKFYLTISEIDESSDPLTSEDKYRILDKKVKDLGLRLKVNQEKIVTREVKTFYSYLEASKERDKMMNITSSTN